MKSRYLRKLDIKLVDGEFENPVQEQVRDPGQVYKIFQSIKDKNQETLIGVYLDADHTVKAYDVLSVGGEDVSLVIPREIFGRAFMIKAYTFVLIHNHPKGDPKPSDDDKNVMKELMRGVKELKLNFLDFIIVGEEGYWSMFEDADGGDYSLGSVI